MGNSKQPETLSLIGPTWDVHNWPRFADYRTSEGSLIPVGQPVKTYDATQVGTLAGELLATGYQYPRDPTVLLPFARQYGLLTAHMSRPGTLPPIRLKLSARSDAMSSLCLATSASLARRSSRLM